ncbi:MAG: TonB-dependent receptor [Chitinophagaceae bacterium]|nr:TonB-dependent receptor [Chitinophagaceae bacterium]
MRLLICLLVLSLRLQAQEPPKHTISGTVRAKVSGETILRATIVVDGKNTGVTTNDYGFFSITLPDGKYTLIISAVGWETKALEVTLHENLQLQATMEIQGTQLQDATVTAQTRGRSIRGTQMGVEHLSTKEIKNVPVLFGERDVLKTLQLLPGVKPVSQGTSGISVRGGSADQNLILLDEAPVYNASHLLGFFSTFNSDAIKDVTLYKGGMPAQYGGRLSSVVDVRMNDGNNQDFHVSGGLGAISAKINVEGPIEKDRSSFLLSARRTYYDMFLKLSKDSTVNKNSLYFYDLNAKLNFTLGSRDKLYLSGYFGRDNMASQDIFGLNWGNATSTLRWNHTFGPRFFSNTSLIYSYYNYKLRINNNGTNFNVLSELRDWNIKEELQFYINPRNNVRVGFNSIYHTLNPGVLTGGPKSGVNDTSFQKRYGLENAVFAGNSWKVSDKLDISYGGRLSIFSALGKGDFYKVSPEGVILDTMHYNSGQVVKTYVNPEIRVAFSYQLNEASSVKVSYVDNTQNMHLISSTNAGFPTDLWVVSNNMIKPERSHQVSLGYYKNFDFRENAYEFTAETYYKALENQIDYRDGAQLTANGTIETELLFGKGRAYGAEWLIRKKTGRLTGWIGYTLSKSEKQIPGINEDRWYNAVQDKTHDISVVGMYKLNPKWMLSANWVYTTGNAVSFPSGKYRADGRTVYYYSERNGYRMPAYHRLDLSATVQLKQRKRYSSEMAFGVYNAYNRNNAFIITFRDNKTDPNKTEAVRTTLFGAVPYISYNFKF